MNKKALKATKVILAVLIYITILYLLLEVITDTNSEFLCTALYIFIPKSLYLEKLLEETPPKEDFKIGHLYYVLGLIRHISFKSPKNMDNEGFVRINAQALTSHIKKGCKILQYFVDAGVFERMEYCTTQNRSRGYKFTEKYNKEFVLMEIDHKPYRPRKRNTKKTDSRAEKMKVFFNPSLTIDDAVFEWINLFPDYYIKKGEPKKFERSHHRYMAIKIQRGEFPEPHFDDTSGRFHSLMTGIKKEGRNFLAYDGERFVQVDLSQSQLFLTIRLFSPDFYSPEKTELITMGHLLPSIRNHYKQYNTNYTPIPYFNTPLPHPFYDSSSIMFGKSSVSLSGCLKSDFVSHVTSEGFYYQFLDEIKLFGELRELTKQDLKEAVFYVAYGREGLKYVPDEKIKFPIQAFKKCYPNVLALYSALKRGKGKDSYKFLPRMLQNIESVLFVDRIVPRFIRENKGVPIYTVHDCALVPVSYKAKLEKIVVEETEKAIGYKPCYDVEELIPEKAFESISSTIEQVQYFTNSTIS